MQEVGALRVLGLLELKKFRPKDAPVEMREFFKMKVIEHLRLGFLLRTDFKLPSPSHLPEKDGVWSLVPMPEKEETLGMPPGASDFPHPHSPPAPELEEEADGVLRAAQLVAITHTIKSQRGGQPCPPAAPVWSLCQSWGLTSSSLAQGPWVLL